MIFTSYSPLKIASDLTIGRPKGSGRFEMLTTPKSGSRRVFCGDTPRTLTFSYPFNNPRGTIFVDTVQKIIHKLID